MSDARTAIRPMAARDVAEAARISRFAFGTFMQAPDLENFRRDLGTVATRFVTDPRLALVAEADGRLLGSVLGMDCSSHLTLGPLSVDTPTWGIGAARCVTAA